MTLHELPILEKKSKYMKDVIRQDYFRNDL